MNLYEEKRVKQEKKVKERNRRIVRVTDSYVPTKSELEELYVKQGRSLKGIAKLLNSNYSLIRNKAIEYGFRIRNISESQRLGFELGYIDRSAYKKPTLSDEERKRRSERLKEYKSSIIPLGYSLKPSGYCEYTIGENKYRRVHDVIMEQHIGRKLLPDECVHHINGIRNDNRIENLQLLTKSEHSRLHCMKRIASGEQKRDSKGRFVFMSKTEKI